MTETETRAAERTVEVSPQVLALISPESCSLVSSSPDPSLMGRIGMGLRVRRRLAWTRVRFRFDDFQAVRCYGAGLRLKARLLWMKLRHRDRFLP